MLVAAITFLTFLPAVKNQFVNWDDTVNFVKNHDYRGLAWTNLRWMATTSLMGQWIPLTWLTLGIDYLLWGMNPFGYHLTNIVLHSASAMAFYFLARRLLALGWPSLDFHALDAGALAAALFFAIHPLRAESVAWITERRDVLSGLFFLLAVLAYLRARSSEPRAIRWLAVSVCFYVLAALSKSIVVSIPVLLLLLDVYPLRRLDLRRPRASIALRLLAEKTPYLVIASATALLAIWAQQTNRFLTSLDALPVLDRVTVGLYSIWFYFARTIAPIHLSPLYELPARVSLLDSRFLWPAIGVLVLALLIALSSRRSPAAAVTAAAYLTILAPVSGVIHNGHQLVHDRYSYLSCLPLAVLFGAGVAFLLHARRCGLVRPIVSRLGSATVAAWIATLAILTAQQVTVWRDDDTLWRFALEGDPACSICYANLGVALSERGLVELAIPYFQRAVSLRPDRIRHRANLGVALLRTGRAAEALVEFEKVRSRHPDDLNNRNNLAVALMRVGQRQEGMAELRRILERDPQNVLARTNLAVGLAAEHRADEAARLLERVVADAPDQISARVALIWSYLALNRPDDAKAAVNSMRPLDPRTANVLEGLFVATW